MKKIRKCVSCIAYDKIGTFRNASISVQPVNKPICKKLDTHSVVKTGSQSMKNDGFVLTRGIKYV